MENEKDGLGNRAGDRDPSREGDGEEGGGEGEASEVEHAELQSKGNRGEVVKAADLSKMRM